MEDIGYLDFDLQIERAGQGYRANVLSSPAGQASSDFALPFSDLELENFVLRMSRTHRGARRLGTPELEATRTFGGRLYEAVFGGEVRGCLRSSLDEAARQGRGLRLRLRLTEAPELVDLPWEYLYSPALNRFFALSTHTPLVRYLDLPEPVTLLAVQPPLRLLAVIASPRDFPALDVDQEWQKLRAALKDLEDAGRVTVERLQPPTLNALQRRLRSSPCHILHFIGHGAFDESTQDGQLLLEDQDGRGNIISAQDLGVILHDHHSLRLVVLNSCEGARTSRTDPFAGAAQSLVQQGMPAVLAMQFEISDDAAIVIGHEFYNALAAGYPVDAALSEARKAAFTGGNSAEWGTPVLYLRAPDARIFGMDAAPQINPPVAPPRPAARRAANPGLLLVLGGVLAVLALAFGISRILPGPTKGPGPAATSTAREAGTADVPPAAGLAPGTPTDQTPAAAEGAPRKSIDQLVEAYPKVLSLTAGIRDLVPAADGVWAATTGGLMRWKGDGTSTVFTSADGLPFSYTDALLAMPDGSLWAGGRGAVVHLEPDENSLGQIEHYSAAEGVNIGESPILMRDADGSVWVAFQYQDPPVLRFDGSLWRPPDIPSDDPLLKNLKPLIVSMIRSRDGSLWLGLYRDGILRWDGKSWARFGAEQGITEKERIWRLLEDGRGTLWAANGEGGLLRFEPAAGTWKRIEFQQAYAHIFSISELPGGRLWASAPYFIAESEDDGEHWAMVATPEDKLNYPGKAVQDGGGVVWVATSDGIASYEGGKWRVLRRPGELSWHQPGQIMPDPDGKLWVLPAYGGAPSVVDPSSGEASAPPGWPPQAPDVLSVAFADGATWAGTSKGLLRLKEGAVKTLTSEDGLPENSVGALVATTDTLWIGTPAGLARLDLASGKVTGTIDALQGQQVDVLALAHDGAVWAGTHWGEGDKNSALHRIAGADHQSWANDEPPLTGARLYVDALMPGEDGNMWMASDAGVYRWDGDKWTQMAPRGDIYAILPNGGDMWIAGHGGEISRWDATDGWQSFRPKGLTADVLDMYVTPDGSFWLATGDGLLRYAP